MGRFASHVLGLFFALAAGLLPSLIPGAAVGAFLDPVDLIHTWEGEVDGDNFGFVNRLVGDVDGDGTTDIGVGVPGHAAAGENAGKVYIYSGASGSLIRTHLGGAENDRFGYEVAGVGDVNGDDIDDYAVCRPRSITFQQFFGLGEIVLFSGATGDSLKAWNSGQYGLGFGAQVAGAGNFMQGGIGDLNGDGTPDILMSILLRNGGANLSGAVMAVSGADWDEVLFTVFGEQSIDLFGFGMGGVGDLNDDGCDDFVVGAPNAGEGDRGLAYVFSGCDGAEFPFSPLVPDTTGNFFGFLFPKGTGDVNGDGVPDISVTDLQDSEFGTNAGKAYVFSGLDGSVLHKWTGTTDFAGLGVGRGCGDVNFDGYADLIYASFTDPTVATGAGTAQIFSGFDGSVLRTIRNDTEGDNFGYSTTGAGDINGDGALDFLVSAINYDGDGTDRGKVFVIEGDIFADPASAPTSPGDLDQGQSWLRVQPNPVWGDKVRVLLQAEDPQSFRVTVFDSQGRRVRALFDGVLEAGEQTLTWDRLDDRGLRVPAGVYFVALRPRDGRPSEVGSPSLSSSDRTTAARVVVR